jgi:hypothetical protein
MTLARVAAHDKCGVGGRESLENMMQPEKMKILPD